MNFYLVKNLKSNSKNIKELIKELITKNKEKIIIVLYLQLINCDEEDIFTFYFILKMMKN